MKYVRAAADVAVFLFALLIRADPRVVRPIISK